MTSPPPLTGRLTPPEFDYFADVVMRFVDAAGGDGLVDHRLADLGDVLDHARA